jgi:hypothetical protein
MRYPASEKAEIIRLVEQSHLPAKRTLDKLGIPPPRFTAGMIDIATVDLRRWLTTVLDRIGRRHAKKRSDEFPRNRNREEKLALSWWMDCQSTPRC